MRVTNWMMMKQALHDLDGLKRSYMKAQSAVHGRALERPSDDPQRVVEAMDLSGSKLRMERAQRAGQDAREWLSIGENSLSAMIDRLQAARETALQSAGPSGAAPDAREAMAHTIESIRDSLVGEMNGKHRDQYLFSGWKIEMEPFGTDGSGEVSYLSGSNGVMTRDVAPGLSVGVTLPGNQLLAGGNFLTSLTRLAADIRAGRTTAIGAERLKELDMGLTNLTVIRSDLGVRYEQVEHYERYAQEVLFQIEERLTGITGTDLETAVLKMTEAQSAYQAALASFSKALPTSLIDYLR